MPSLDLPKEAYQSHPILEPQAIIGNPKVQRHGDFVPQILV